MQPDRIHINLEAGDGDRSSARVISSVQERFIGFFDLPDRVEPFTAGECSADGATGFPKVLDLSRYYSGDESKAAASSPSTNGKSLFAIEMERLRGEPAVTSTGTNIATGGGDAEREVDDGGVDRAIANLELIDDYSRLAVDAVQLDLATKCLRNVRSRQEQNLTHLFDALSNASDMKRESAVLQSARFKIDSIKEIYLEENLAENGRLSVKFAEHIKSALGGAWTFVPIRTVLDAIQSRRSGEIQPGDVEIVQLSLLWSVLVLYERPTLFRSFSPASEVYCRVAEIYLMGPNIFEEPLVQKCSELIITTFLLTEGHEQRLLFRLDQPMAGLDVFKHFYGDLLDHFEEFSNSDDNFAILILVAAYVNASLADSLAMMQLLWTTERFIVRQITTPIDKTAHLLSSIGAERDKRMEEAETDHFSEYEKLLTLYATAIRDGVVTSGRNPTPWAIASDEISAFVRKHSVSEGVVQDAAATASQRELRALAHTLQTTVRGKLSL